MGDIPKYMSAGACAFDFVSPERVVFAPGEWKMIDTGVIVEIPRGYALQIHARSGTFKNYGIMLVNGVGIIDNDYCGPNDTIKLAYINMSDKEQVIEKGDRFGQGMFVQVGIAEFELHDFSGGKDRGGFGGTGKQ